MFNFLMHLAIGSMISFIISFVSSLWIVNYIEKTNYRNIITRIWTTGYAGWWIFFISLIIYLRIVI